MSSVDFIARGLARKLELDLASDVSGKGAELVAAHAGASVSAILLGYSTRTALKALTPTDGDRVFLSEAGRAGEFIFDASDLSAKVAVDTAQGIFIAPDSDADGSSGAWVRVFIGNIHADWFGIDPSNAASTTDHAAALQCAINVAQLFVSDYMAAPAILLSPGRYNVASTVTLKSAPLLGVSASVVGTNIFWTGAAGGTMFTKDGTYSGGVSWGLIANIGFRKGTNKPAVFLQFNSLVDNGFRLRELLFSGCTGNAIEANAGWVNCHWQHLRFEGVDGYGIYLKPYASQSFSSFALSQFTYDSANATTNVKGVLGVDVTLNNTNVGFAALAHGRVEINTKPLIQGIVNWVTTDAAKTGQIEFILDDITYADGGNVSAADGVIYGSRAGGGNSNATLIARDLWLDSMSAIYTFAGGTFFWGGSEVIPLPSNGRISYLNLRRDGDAVRSFSSNGFEAIGNAAGDSAFAARQKVDTDKRFKMTADGKAQWGSGSAVFDVELTRGTTDTLQLSSGDKFRPADAAGQKLGDDTHTWRVYHDIIATASLPAAATAMNGVVLIEDNGAGDRNLIVYAGGQRFRIDGGAAF